MCWSTPGIKKYVTIVIMISIFSKKKRVVVLQQTPGKIETPKTFFFKRKFHKLKTPFNKRIYSFKQVCTGTKNEVDPY